MHVYKVFYTFESQIFEDLKSRYNLQWTHFSWKGGSIYSWVQDEEVAHILVFIENIFELKNILTFIEENFLNIQEHLILWVSYPFWTLDIKKGDIILPHTCIHVLKDREQNPLFLESTIWENLDFQKFWLILNGICCTIPQDSTEEDIQLLEETYWEWVYDTTIFPLLLEIKQTFSPENMILIQKVFEPWDIIEEFANLYDIVEFMH